MPVAEVPDSFEIASDELRRSLQKHTAAHLKTHVDRPPDAYTDGRRRDIHLIGSDEERADGVLSRLSGFLERLTRPRINFGERDFSSYHVFGALGILAGAIVALVLISQRGLSLVILIELILLSTAISWLNVYITKKLTGKDRLVFLRYFIPILACGILFLRITGQPVVSYIEPLILGMGTMQGLGRIGCFMVGCCHGKPSRIGFRYNETHAQFGFPRRLLGVRFFPVQLLESTWIFVSVGTGVALVMRQAPPGLGLAAYLILFSAGRFCMEMIRGDRWRRHFGYFSEAQWVSYAIISGVCLLGWYDVLPYRSWHVVTWMIISLLAIYVAFRRMMEPGQPLDSPLHRSEIIRSLAVLEKGRLLPSSLNHAVHLRTTSAAVQLSLGRVYRGDQDVYHYTLSFSDRDMRLREARMLANIIGNWHPHPGKAKLIEETSHVFHLIRQRSGGS